jgi:hypothetical protein
MTTYPSVIFIHVIANGHSYASEAISAGEVIWRREIASPTLGSAPEGARRLAMTTEKDWD